MIDELGQDYDRRRELAKDRARQFRFELAQLMSRHDVTVDAYEPSYGLRVPLEFAVSGDPVRVEFTFSEDEF